MSIAQQAPPTASLAQATDLLAQLRAKIQRYLFGEGLFATLAWIAAAFWITLAIDWTFEPHQVIRALMLLAVLGVSAWLMYRYWYSRAQVPLTDTSMALLLERKYRDFHDSLITSVELQQQPRHAQAFHPQMLARTQADAAMHLKNVELSQIMNTAPLGGKVMLALVAAASVLIFGLFQPEAFGVWKDRVLLLSSDLWPRKTSLTVEGFPDSKSRKIGQGGETTIMVKADLTKDVPKSVRIRYNYQGGDAVVEEMFPLRREGDFQFYQFKFVDLPSSVDFEIRGGDARLRGYRLEVVENPQLTALRLQCEYPAYMNRTPQTLEKLSGLVAIPQGTKVTLLAKANKNLQELKVDLIQGDQAIKLKQGEPGPAGQSIQLLNQRDVSLDLGTMSQDLQLIFRLRDQDEIDSRDADITRLNIAVRPDEVPRVGLRLSGIGSAITPFATLPVVGDTEDDYGLSRVWIEYHIEQTANTRQRTLPLPPVANDQLRLRMSWSKENQPELYRAYEPDKYLGLDLQLIQEEEKNAAEKAAKDTDKAPVDEGKSAESKPVAAPAAATPWKLVVGQKLNVVTKAVDGSTLVGGPFVGVGEKYQLEVVSREQMAAILEAREVTLRQRFETIVSEFTQMRDNLSAIRFKAAASSRERDPLDPEDAAAPMKPMASSEEIQRAINDERLMLTDRALEKVERSAYEVQELSRAFLEILAEFDNNRISTPENEIRLRTQIAMPLERVGRRMKDPELKLAGTLNLQLQELRRLTNDQTRGPGQQQTCVNTADSILVEMKLILDKMLELEDYNQLLAKVRKLIAEQERLNSETKQIQKQKLLE